MYKSDGIVIEQAVSVSCFGVDSPETGAEDLEQSHKSPFYLAISSYTIKNIIPEIYASVPVFFEDFQ